MKTTKQKLILGISITSAFAACILIFSFGTLVGQEFYQGVQVHNGTTGNIQKVLEKNCNCDAEFAFSSFGIHFSKENGANGNTADFTLKKYAFDTTIAEEASRLNKILNEEVEGYKDIEVLHLNFVDGEQEGTVTIKKGMIQ